MAATQSQGFELFTETFQKQYSIAPSMLRGVAWEVWRNELSEDERRVWENMAAPPEEAKPAAPPAPEKQSAPSAPIEKASTNASVEPPSTPKEEATAPTTTAPLSAPPHRNSAPPVPQTGAQKDAGENPDEDFFIESETLQIPPQEETQPPKPETAKETDPPPTAAPHGGDILKDVLTHRPAEDEGISESSLISLTPRHKKEAPGAGASLPGQTTQGAPDAQPSERPGNAPDEQPDSEPPSDAGAESGATPGHDKPEKLASLSNEGLPLWDLDQVLEDTQPSHLLDTLASLRSGSDNMLTKEGGDVESLEIEPVEDGDLSDLIVEEPAPKAVGPMPGRNVAELALARFKAAAAMVEEQTDPDFLVDESEALEQRQAQKDALQIVAERVAAHHVELVELLLQRGLKGDTAALRLCIHHALPENILANLSQALVEHALRLGREKQPDLLALLSSNNVAPSPTPEQARTMADHLTRLALQGDSGAMELCLKLSPPLSLQASLKPLAEKLLHRALKDDILLLALFLERLGPPPLSEDDAAGLEQALLTLGEQGEASALKACLASLLADEKK